ncbi:MAG: hypothetical protein ACXVDD_12890 [Polyangia bacterium]
MPRTLGAAVALVALIAACGDDTVSATKDLASCAPLTTGNQICPPCDPGSSSSCGSEQEGFQCQYSGDHCVCHSGRWSCSSQPFPTRDLALPSD